MDSLARALSGSLLGENGVKRHMQCLYVRCDKKRKYQRSVNIVFRKYCENIKDP